MHGRLTVGFVEFKTRLFKTTDGIFDAACTVTVQPSSGLSASHKTRSTSSSQMGRHSQWCVARCPSKCNAAPSRETGRRRDFGAVGNTLFVAGERLSVDGTIGVGDGGCAAAVAIKSDVSCVGCEEDVATDAMGLRAAFQLLKMCMTTDHGLCGVHRGLLHNASRVPVL